MKNKKRTFSYTHFPIPACRRVVYHGFVAFSLIFAVALPLHMGVNMSAVLAVDAEPAEESETVNYSVDSKTLSEMMDYIKEKWDSGELEDREQIEEAIEDGAQEFDIFVDNGTKELLAGLIEKANELGIDRDVVLEQAEKLYKTYGDEILENAEEVLREQLAGPLGDSLKEQLMEPVEKAAKETLIGMIKNFWKDLVNSVVTFFKNLFHIK